MTDSATEPESGHKSLARLETAADKLKAADLAAKTPVSPAFDIEHLVVRDDPRNWSNAKKTTILAIVSMSSLVASIASNIFFPALADLQRDLKASDELVATSVSIFILGQGVFPLGWSVLGEFWSRKKCYITSFAIFIAATIGASRSPTMPIFVGMRTLQSLGSSSVYALGGGTIADIYDTHERGTKIGIYYAPTLLGTSIGPLLGGAVVERGGWRATFYFLAAYAGVMLLCFIWLPETFRKERSLAWRLAMVRARAHAKAKIAKANAALPSATGEPAPPVKDRSNQRTTKFSEQSPTLLERGEPAEQAPGSTLQRVLSKLSGRSGEDAVKIRFRDVNPLGAFGQVFRQPNNVLAIMMSGLLFGSQYCVTYTASRSFSAPPYNYSAILVGLVLLSYGVGNVIGSLGGGRYSDAVFRRLKEENGGVGEPEMRIKSTIIAMPPLPAFFIVYAWVVQKETPIYWPIIALFVLGLTTIWIYSSTLAYVVDSNPGRSSSAVACNSLVRGISGCVASQIAEPIIKRIGNGWFYTGWAFVLLAGSLLFLLVSARGKAWREKTQEKENAKAQSS